ncbi:MAG TPA: pilus assembly protein PilM, partial [Fibrobacteria bacterium]|nr:pilus assembly protein PilM [Fibrobacteria bacterium]
GRGHPSLQSLAREIQRSIRFYLKESGQPRLASLALAGGGAADPGLRDYLQRELGVPLEAFDPAVGRGTDAADRRAGPADPKADPGFAQAIGMAIRGVYEFFPHQFK